MRSFETKRVSKSRVSLIKRVKGEERGTMIWVGPMAGELPGICRWVAELDPAETDRFMNSPDENVTSFKEQYRLEQIRLNPMLEWVVEELELKDCRTYLGCKTDKKYDDLLLEFMLFPTYLN